MDNLTFVPPDDDAATLGNGLSLPSYDPAARQRMEAAAALRDTLPFSDPRYHTANQEFQAAHGAQFKTVRDYAQSLMRFFPAAADRAVLLDDMTKRDVELVITEVSRQVQRDVARAQARTAPAVHVMLYGEINAYTRQSLHQAVFGAAASSIHVYISSDGGITRDGLACAYSLADSWVPVYTYAAGPVQSAAVGIFLAGGERFADPVSRFLVHESAYRVYPANQRGLRKILIEAADRLEEENSEITEYYCRRLMQPQATIRHWLASEREFGAAEALSDRFATAVVPNVFAVRPPSPTDRLVWISGTPEPAAIPERFADREMLNVLRRRCRTGPFEAVARTGERLAQLGARLTRRLRP